MPAELTLEEVQELQRTCVICGLEKHSLVGHYRCGRIPYFTLEKCDVKGCKTHCPGHDMSYLEAYNEDYSSVVTGYL